MELEFFGAAGEVTGSCHVVKVAGKTILLDCGMIQGSRKQEKRNRDPFPFDAGKIHAVVLSHAHIDHSGRLPLLTKRGFTGTIHAHNATKDLCRILLRDSAFLGEKDAAYQNKRRARKGKAPIEPLYTAKDANDACKLIQGHRYKERFVVAPGIEVTFHDAGHIMGSCVVEITAEEKGVRRSLVFSGDLGQYDTPILRDPESLPEADLVLMESTYGNRTHRDRKHTIQEIGEIIRRADGKGNILIPAFAVGRSQEILYTFGKHYDEWNMSRWRIFLDSPMAIEASEIYWNYPHLYDDEATKLRKSNDEMPPLPNLKFSRSSDDSRRLNKIKKGAIIVAGSGMCNGGRILHHLKHNVWKPETQVMIVGYQAYGSIGRKLVEGDQYIRIHGDPIKVAAQVNTVGGLSAHGDQGDLLHWYSRFKNRPPVFMVHGEKKAAAAFKEAMKKQYGAKVTLTKPGLKIDLKKLSKL